MTPETETDAAIVKGECTCGWAVPMKGTCPNCLKPIQPWPETAIASRPSPAIGDETFDGITFEHHPNGVPGGGSFRGIPYATWLATDTTDPHKHKAVGVGNSKRQALSDLFEFLKDEDGVLR